MRLLVFHLATIISLATPAGALLAGETELETSEQICITLTQGFTGLSEQRQDAAEQELQTRKKEILAWAKDHPHSAPIRYAAGLACLVTEDTARALPHFAEAYELSAKSPDIGMMYSMALRFAKQPLQALEVLEQLVEKHPAEPRLRFSLAMQQLLVQQYDQAKPNFQALLGAIEAPSEKALLLGLIGRCDLYLGLHKQAIDNISKAEATDPGDVRRLVPLAEAYLKVGRLEEARTTLRKVYRINEEYPASLFWIGVLLETQGEPGATKFFRRALEAGEKTLVSDNGGEHFLLYQICAKLGLNEKAAGYKQEAAKLHFTFEAPWQNQDDVNR